VIDGFETSLRGSKKKQKVNEIGIIIHLQRFIVTRQKQRKTDGFSRCVLLLYKRTYFEQLRVQNNKWRHF
jgi:hypothetical protein